VMVISCICFYSIITTAHSHNRSLSLVSFFFPPQYL
jgi:hypothetical protein